MTIRLRLRRLIRMDEITRRYFVLNAFDGTLATFSGVFALSLLAHESAHVIVVAGLATSVAMGVSGFFGAYLTERAERLVKIRRLESALLTNLENSKLADEAAQASISAAIIDGLSPLLAALAIIAPYLATIIAPWLLPPSYDFLLSIAIGFSLLFGLGFFLGRLSRSNAVFYGLLMVGVGILAAVIVVLLDLT